MAQGGDSIVRWAPLRPRPFSRWPPPGAPCGSPLAGARPGPSAIGIGVLTDTGNRVFVPLERVRTHRNTDKGGYRWYSDYRLPEQYAGGIITVRLHGNADDEIRRFNRTENIRQIPQTDLDFKRLFRRRNDAESINRALDDTLWLRRAHSVGHARQHLNLLTYALTVNSLALWRHKARQDEPPLPLAA